MYGHYENDSLVIGQSYFMLIKRQSIFYWYKRISFIGNKTTVTHNWIVKNGVFLFEICFAFQQQLFSQALNSYSYQIIAFILLDSLFLSNY